MQLLKPRREERADTAEAELVRSASKGDAEAFAVLYRLYLDRIFRYFYYRVGDRQDAEDLTEQVFLKAWQGIRSYADRGLPFSSWLYRLAHNLLVDTRRAHREIDRLDEALEIEAPGLGPDEVVAQREEVRKLAWALSQLSPLEQSVVALRFIAGLDHRSVAAIVDKSEVTTRSIQSRALARLARLLGVQEGG